jgi:hypothetical protein
VLSVVANLAVDVIVDAVAREQPAARLDTSFERGLAVAVDDLGTVALAAVHVEGLADRGDIQLSMSRRALGRAENARRVWGLDSRGVDDEGVAVHVVSTSY